jgi:hypothetical protein
MDLVTLSIAAILGIFLYRGYRKTATKRRDRYIDAYEFPDAIKQKVKTRYPHLTEAQLSLIIRGLKEYFHVCNLAGRKMVAMPSQAIDLAWHEFILFTRAYQHFCQKSLGRFLHHTPVQAMDSPTRAHSSIKRTWHNACLREGINPRRATRLPLLFGIDAILDIPDGFKYSLNCKAPGSHEYCASHLGCGDGCAGDGDGGNASDGDSGCGGGCGGD